MSRKQIGPTESRFAAVIRAKEPEDIDAGQVHSFLGLVNFGPPGSFVT